jgi:hypothetical protein
MTITPLRVLVFLVACAAIWLTLRRYRENAIGFRSAAVWVFLLGIIALTSLLPGLLGVIIPLTGMGSRMVVVLLVGILILYALIFNVTSRLEKMERDIRRLTQQRALERLSMDSGGQRRDGVR